MTDGDILREIERLEATGLTLADAIERASEELGMDVEEVKAVWFLYDLCGGAG